MAEKPKRIHNWRSTAQMGVQVLIDIIMINAAWLLALYLFYDMHVPPEHMDRFIRLWPFQTVIQLAAFYVTRMYKSLWRYASVDEMLRIVMGTLLGIGACFVLSVVGYTFQRKPNLFLFRRSIYMIAWLLLLVFAMAQRFSNRLINQIGVNSRALSPEKRKRVLVVGAGWAGASVIRELIARGYRDGMPVAVVDDDEAKASTRISNVPIVLGIDSIPQYVERYQADIIVIAIPSATNTRMRQIMSVCAATNCRLRIVSAMKDVTDGPNHISAMRDVNVTDLLCRDEVKLDMASISGYLTGKAVLVTGGGGSIGSELCRQIAAFKPSRLIVLDFYENNAYELEQELRAKHGEGLKLTILIGSVRDPERLDAVFAAHRPDVVFHAAAHKHVPLMEDSPAEAVKNNIFGTWNVAACADRYGVERLVHISTDKAVNPTNVMGATKRVTEMIIQYWARRSKTRFMAVRFGNVLGSNGSVIPLFAKQIERGGPVSVTHPEITRFFMTIPEAAQLVLQAGAMEESGSIFVLNMGTPVKIVDLARNLIRAAGYVPDVDIKIEFCGLRPGEKLYEELAMSEETETLHTTCHDKITVLGPVEMDDKAFLNKLNALRDAAASGQGDIRAELAALVPSFKQEQRKVG